MPKIFYITTPLYYVNASPHIGHSYTNIAADALARYMRLRGEKAFLLTGTDEHGQKIEEAAKAKGLSPKQFADSIVPAFVELWKLLDISYDDFIRTTETRHTEIVEKALDLLHKKGDLYAGDYSGWYCTPCERFWTDTEISDSASGQCLECKRPVHRITERNYFFKLSKYQAWLIDYIKTHPRFVLPEIRRNEILSFLANPLQDLCITRPKSRLSWGIKVPFSDEHVTYVWFDALLNYITAPGFLKDEKRFASIWPADMQFIGKDILRPHAVYWPIMLHALGLELPRTIFAHGWWLIEGEKISKSKGVAVNPIDVVEKYGIDAYRYFLLREATFGGDGVYSEEALVLRLNSDLANDLGNLVYRTLTMIEKHFGGIVPKPDKIGCAVDDEKLIQLAKGLPSKINSAMGALNYGGTLSSIWELINCANKYVETSAPWTLAKQGETTRLSTVIYNLAETLRIVSIAISPFMPQTAKRIWEQLNVGTPLEKCKFDDIGNWGLLKPGGKIKKGLPLFPRIEKKI